LTNHFLGRALREQGHDVRLMPAQFVRPFVKSNKNDYRDAEAIAEAVERENMRFVPIKTEDQLDVQARHRVRERWVSRQTAARWVLRSWYTAIPERANDRSSLLRLVFLTMIANFSA